MPYRVVLTLKNGTVSQEMGPVINSLGRPNPGT